MWSSFYRAFFVLGLIMGLEEIIFGTYWAIKGNRLMALRWALRGLSFVVLYSFSLLWFPARLLDPWSDPVILAAAILPIVFTVAIDAYLRVRVEHKPLRSAFAQSSRNALGWEHTRALGKRRFILGHTLVFGLAMVLPAIVFSVVSPELMRPFWWVSIILVLALIGFIIGNRQWNYNEKKLRSQVNSPS